MCIYIYVYIYIYIHTYMYVYIYNAYSDYEVCVSYLCHHLEIVQCRAFKLLMVLLRKIRKVIQFMTGKQHGGHYRVRVCVCHVCIYIWIDKYAYT